MGFALGERGKGKERGKEKGKREKEAVVES
jgi:hypothetical protein